MTDWSWTVVVLGFAGSVAWVLWMIREHGPRDPK